MVFLEIAMEFLLEFFFVSIGIIDSNVAELLAIAKALDLCFSIPIFNFINRDIPIESNSKIDVSWVHNPNSSPWKLASVMKSIVHHFQSYVLSPTTTFLELQILLLML